MRLPGLREMDWPLGLTSIEGEDGDKDTIDWGEI